MCFICKLAATPLDDSRGTLVVGGGDKSILISRFKKKKKEFFFGGEVNFLLIVCRVDALLQK